MTTEIKIVGIYARVSTNKQENDNQLDQLRTFAAKQGWEIVAEFVDIVSGSGKLKRPQFDKMMLAASQRKFDLLLFWKLDRLSREGVRKTLGHLEKQMAGALRGEAIRNHTSIPADNSVMWLSVSRLRLPNRKESIFPKEPWQGCNAHARQARCWAGVP